MPHVIGITLSDEEYAAYLTLKKLYFKCRKDDEAFSYLISAANAKDKVHVYDTFMILYRLEQVGDILSTRQNSVL